MPNNPYTGYKGNPATVPENPPASNQQPPPNSGGLQSLFPLLDNVVDTNLAGWGQTCEYFTDMGLRSSPLAAGFGALPAAVYRCHAGKTWKVVSTVSLCVVGQQDPKAYLPSPDTGSPNDVLQWWRAVTFTPSNLLAGDQTFGALLVLYYSLRQPVALGVDVLDFLASPLNTTPAGAQTLNPQNFFQYLSQASTVGGQPGSPINF